MKAVHHLAAATVVLAVCAPASAQQVQLKAGTFLPQVDNFWYPPIQKFLDTVNDKGKAVGK